MADPILDDLDRLIDGITNEIICSVTVDMWAAQARAIRTTLAAQPPAPAADTQQLQQIAHAASYYLIGKRFPSFTIRLQGKQIQIKPHWAGQGIAIHKPVTIHNDGLLAFARARGYWKLTHINTGNAIGTCLGSLNRAKRFAMEWDAEFAALQPGQDLAPDRLDAWRRTAAEMSIKPPRAPFTPRRVRRSAVIQQEED